MREMKETQIGKKEIKLPLLLDMTLCLKDSADSIRKLLDTVNSLSRVT